MEDGRRQDSTNHSDNETPLGRHEGLTLATGQTRRQSIFEVARVENRGNTRFIGTAIFYCTYDTGANQVPPLVDGANNRIRFLLSNASPQYLVVKRHETHSPRPY